MIKLGACRAVLSRQSRCAQREEIGMYLFVGLQVVNKVIDSVDSLLHCEVEFMVFSTQLVGHLPGCHQVRRPLDAYAEGVQGMRPVKGILGLLQMPTQPIKIP